MSLTAAIVGSAFGLLTAGTSNLFRYKPFLRDPVYLLGGVVVGGISGVVYANARVRIQEKRDAVIEAAKSSPSLKQD